MELLEKILKMTQNNKKPIIDWESMRENAPIFHKGEKDHDRKDDMNSEIIRCVHIEDNVETTMESIATETQNFKHQNPAHCLSHVYPQPH